MAAFSGTAKLIDLPFHEYLEFTRCRAVLVTALPAWNLGDTSLVKDVGGKDPIERIRRLMSQCHDELPSSEPEVAFISDPEVRHEIQDRIHAAWTDFNAREWMGATVFAGAALEALLLWALKQPDAAPTGGTGKEKREKSVDDMHLTDLIDQAAKGKLIKADSESQARLAKDARNLIHPGKVARSGASCNKATALTALAGLYRVIDDLKQPHVAILFGET